MVAKVVATKDKENDDSQGKSPNPTTTYTQQEGQNSRPVSFTFPHCLFKFAITDCLYNSRNFLICTQRPSRERKS